MKSYGAGNKPRVNPPGENYYYNGAIKYKAAEIDKVEKSFLKAMNTLAEDIKTNLTSFSNIVDQLNEDFGANFFKLNGQPLGFVDVDAFTTLSRKLNEIVNENIDTSEEFFTSCKTKIDEINTWINSLETNYDSYFKAKVLYYYVKDNEDVSASTKSKRKQEMNKYKELPQEPISYGKWVRK